MSKYKIGDFLQPFKNFNILHCRHKHSYDEPLCDTDLDGLSHKKFSYQTNKKIRWIKNMYVDWRNYRNSISPGEMVNCDMDNVESIDRRKMLNVPKVIN